MKNPRILLLILSCLLLFQGSYGGHAIVSKDQRHLQSPFDFELDATAVYNFVFNTSTPDIGPTVVETEELVRLTEIFYRRTFSYEFPSSFQSIVLTYKSHIWDSSFASLSVNFGVSLAFSLTGDMPSDEKVLDIFTNVDSGTYIKNYVFLGEPKDFFLWTNSTEIVALMKALETDSAPTARPTEAPVNLPLFLFEAPVPIMASNVSETETETVPPSVPTPVAPGYFHPSPTFKPEDSQSPPIEDEQQDVPEEHDSSEEIQDEDAIKADQILTDQNEANVLSAFSNELTAIKLFLWLMAVRFIHYLVSLVLQRWGYSYQVSDKKGHLLSYWVQFTLYVPLLAVLTLSLIALQNANDFLVEMGLLVFSHAAMMLLALLGMEIFVRPMDRTLLLQRFIFIATILYVMSDVESGLSNPMDKITFGVMECMGVCSELAAQWALINYRSWSDATANEKNRIRHGVAYILQVCLSCSFISKMLFFASSVVWYVFRFDELTGSFLVFILPLARLIQVPTLLRSFYVQTRLFSQVASAPYEKELEEKHLDLEYEEEDSTEQGSHKEQQDHLNV